MQAHHTDPRQHAEAILLGLNTRPLVVSDYDVFVELRCEVEKLEDLIQRKAEEFGVSDPGAATAVELLLEMRAAVARFDEEGS